MIEKIIQILLIFWISISCLAGPFAPAAGQAGSAAVPMPADANDVSVFVGWATGGSIERGWIQIDDPTKGYVSYGELNDALGPAQGQDTTGVASLGDAGVAVLTFDEPIANGPGPDFAVFENGFAPNISEPNMMFLELAFVEVSSDGIHYERFPAVSVTQSDIQIPPFGYTSTIDTTEIHNFAGKYRRGYGTPFDLDEIRDINDLVDVSAITHVRLIDVVGTIGPYASYDSLGNVVNDPWPTNFDTGTGGFDLDAVGVIHEKILVADFNGDGIVNLGDIAIFSAVWQLTSDDVGWNYKCDLEPFIDNSIDINDFLILIEQWLLTEAWYAE